MRSEEREVRIKELQAAMERLEAIKVNIPDTSKSREAVAEASAAFERLKAIRQKRVLFFGIGFFWW